MTKLSAEDVRGIDRARRFLELGAVDAAAHASPQQLAQINEAVEDLEKAVANADVLGFVHADLRCHAALVELLGSKHLSTAHSDLMAKLRLVITQATTIDEFEAALALHKKFTKLLMAGKLAEARENLATRLDRSSDEVAEQAASRDG